MIGCRNGLYFRKSLLMLFVYVWLSIIDHQSAMAANFDTQAVWRIAQYTTHDKVRDVLGIMENSPSWSDVPVRNKNGQLVIDQSSQKWLLLHSLILINRYDTDTLRKAFSIYLNHAEAKRTNEGFKAESFLFVANRFIFNIPSGFVRSDRSYAGFFGVPVARNADKSVKRPLMRNLLWPLSQNKDGQIDLTGYSLIYSGAPYGAMAEFDEFHKRFGRRNHPRIV